MYDDKQLSRTEKTSELQLNVW